MDCPGGKSTVQLDESGRSKTTESGRSTKVNGPQTESGRSNTTESGRSNPTNNYKGHLDLGWGYFKLG